LLTLAILALTGAIFHRALSEQLSDRFLQHSRHFRVEEISVTGCQLLDRESVLALAAVKPQTSLFAVEPAAVAARVARHPWIKACTLTRRFPNTVVISVTERRAAAALRADMLYVLTEDSMAVLPPHVNWIWDLPILTPPRNVTVTEGQLVRDPQLLGLLSQAMAARRVSADTWQNISELYYRGGDIYATLNHPALELRVGRAASELAWTALSAYVARSGGSLNCRLIDLSIPGKLIVSTEAPTGEERVNG
jgi:cell division protein FtsQ